MSAAHNRAQKRYSARKRNDAVAKALGWQETDIVSVYVRPDGVHIALDTSSTRVELVGETLLPAATLGDVKPDRTAEPSETVRVYAPKTVHPSTWNEAVATIRKFAATKDKANLWFERELPESAVIGGDRAKALRQVAKLFDTLPDVPDWFEHIPLAEV